MRAALLLVVTACSAPPDAEPTTPREPVATPSLDSHSPAQLAPNPAAAACGAPGSTTPPSAVAEIGASSGNTCARLVDGSVWCWGARGVTLVDADVLGSVACPVATRVPELSPAASLSGAACIARESGAVRCGALGQWRFDEEGSLDARRVFFWSDARCAITKSAKIRCDEDKHASDAAALGTVEQIAYYGHDLCVLSAGIVTCRIADKNVVLGTKIATIANGERFLWATRSDGTLLNLERCGDKACEHALTLIKGPVGAVVSAGPRTCLLGRDGHVSCERRCTVMGCKEAGFVEVTGVEEATQIAISADHACALRRDGTIACWGSSSCGESGGDVKAGERCGSTVVPPTTIRWAK